MATESRINELSDKDSNSASCYSHAELHPVRDEITNFDIVSLYHWYFPILLLGFFPILLKVLQFKEILKRNDASFAGLKKLNTDRS